MTDPFSARTRVDQISSTADAAQVSAEDQQTVVRRMQDTSSAALPGAAALQADLQRSADDLRSELAGAEEALAQALGTGAPLFTEGNSEPIALLPVRLETTWWDATSLRVRVYPDDIHLSRFVPELTPAEAEAGAAYWRSPGPEAWQLVLSRLRPDRAAWAVRANRPGAPPPVVRAGNGDGGISGRTVAMPQRWRFLGLVAGEVVVDKLGRPIPDPLPLSLLREEDGWPVDWFEALKAGMGVELSFTDGVDHLDQLLVLGVRGEDAAAGGQWLQDLLLGHAFGDGLAMLPAGTPTNNTPGARSGWSSRPVLPPPGPEPAAGQRPVADALAKALGLPDGGFLRTCEGASDAEPDAVAALSLLTWSTLGKGFAEAAVAHLDLSIPQVRGTDSARPWRTVRDHLAQHVRSRGPLPMVRVGRQPYGILPASALTDWRAERDRDADGLLVPWLRRLRNRWIQALDGIPRVLPDVAVDQVAVDALNRQPVAAGLAMRRMNGPAFTLPRTTPDTPPSQPGIPGLAPDAKARWTTRSDGWTDLGWGRDPATGVPLFVPVLAPEGTAVQEKALATADYLLAVRSFLAGDLAAADFDRDWPVELSSGRETPPRRATFWSIEGTELFDALLFLPNWAFMDGDDGGDDPLRAALAVTSDVDQIVADALEGFNASERDDLIAAAARSSAVLARLEHAFRALAGVPVTRLPELLLEVIDVYAHRLDAWVTSLASARLAKLRASGTPGVRIGGYGWVEELRPPVPREEVDLGGDDGTVTVSAQDGYIHAPSLQHAASAAVLRSGFLSRPGEETFAVNLNSRRARIARWLLGGVRRGQSLGSLLGYRFERALHDAGLDAEIEAYRRAFPAPVVPEPGGPAANADLWSASSEAIAARNVVDGMALARAGTGAGTIAVRQAEVEPILTDLAAALDAVGDLVLAESVHQLVGGNPLRAGLAADTLGRGGDIPDSFATLRTPHRARALTNRVAALLPAGPPGPTGWPADAVAALEPAVEAWVAHLLGPAAGWTISGTVGEEPVELTADRLGLGALATVLDAAAAGHGRLGPAFAAAAGAAPGTPVTFGGPGWAGLHGRASRIRSLLAAAQPVLPQHLPGPGDRPVDLADVRRRLLAFAADPAFAAGSGVPELVALAAVPEQEKGGAESWLSQVRTVLADVLGAEIPLLPRLGGGIPDGRIAAGDIGEWLLRFAAVRPVARAFQETLILAETRAARTERLRAAQDPAADGDAWIGGVFDPARRPQARSHLVWHLPQDIPAGDALVGLLIDEWVELLPGADRLREATDTSPAPNSPPESELTGVAFHYDRPDAKAPHTVLLAVPPDLERGWTADGLMQVLRDTLELAKLRAVDLNDIATAGDLFPGILISSQDGTGKILSALENKRPDTDPEGPFRLEPGYRTPDQDVEPGLAARVHDPLWLLTRQWQFGEFAAQDAGSPAFVRLHGSSTPIDAWRPAGAPSWVPYDLRRGPLDPGVEAEPALVDERLRAEGGAQLLRLLDDAGLLAAAAGSLAPHRLPGGDNGGLDESLVGLLGDRMPDAVAVAAAIDAGTLGPALGDVAGRWRQWWAGKVTDRGPDCFDPHRFEHAAACSTGGTVLRAEEYLGDGLDWYSVDIDPEAEGAPPAAPYTFTDEAIPATVRYGGLPADRFWEMEDARVDLGSADVSTLDTGRLLLISFATVYGNDWFLVPLEVPAGSLTVLDRMLVRDVFGRDHLIERAGRDDPSWSMFTLYSPDPDHPAASGLLLMPTEGGQVGEPLEQVGLTRDELANLAWAVEHRYTDGRGERVDRHDRPPRVAPGPPAPGAPPAYGVQTLVPDYWFPLVPEAVEPSVVHFRLAALNAPGAPSRPEGRLVSDGLWVHEEEVPREGTSVSRRPVLSRWFDGSWHAWVRREKAPGTGESSSGLAFDTVRPTEAWPD
jgi:hypothetical protein